MIAILSIINKEIKLLLRDPGGLIMLFILPASFIFVLSLALQGTFLTADKKEKLEILVINNDRGKIGDEIIKGLENTQYFKLINEINKEKLTLDGAKKLLEKGKYKIIINIPQDTSEAVDFKKDTKIDVLVDPVLSSDFATHITNSIQNFIYISILKNITNISNNIFSEIKEKRAEEIKQQILETTNKKKEIEEQLAQFNNTNLDEHMKVIIGDLYTENIKELNEKINDLNNQLDSNKNRNLNEENLGYTKLLKDNVGLTVNLIYYTKEKEIKDFPNSVQQNVPGWTIFALFWIVQIITLNIMIERQSGAFKRILVSPMTSFQYVIGKSIPYFIVNIIQAVFMFSIGVFILPIFGCPPLVIKNIPGLLIITFGISLTAISLSFLLSSVCKTVSLTASLSGAILILMTIFGGIMVPKFIMPKFMQNISLLVPHGWAFDGYQKILVKDYNIVQILPNFFILLGFSIIFIIISLFYFSKIMRKHK